MTDETNQVAGQQAASNQLNPGLAPTGTVATSAVPAHIIPAALPHPNTSGPLARGLSYIHHFEIELVSDGARLWDAASAEGKQLIADIKGEKAAQADTIAAAKAAPPVAAANPADPAKPVTLDPAASGEAKPAT